MNTRILIIVLFVKNRYVALAEEIETNPNTAKFKVGDRVRITKYKNIFSKSYTINWSREIFVIVLF